jgi:hypothetical protein
VDVKSEIEIRETSSEVGTSGLRHAGCASIVYDTLAIG